MTYARRENVLGRLKEGLVSDGSPPSPQAIKERTNLLVPPECKTKRHEMDRVSLGGNEVRIRWHEGPACEAEQPQKR
jgi:hypothetical protein